MDPLEAIWNQVAKAEADGSKAIRFKDFTDLNFLYASGFVDAKKFNYKQWIDAFKSSREKDGTYKITRVQWLEKKKYHYDGPVKEPFDPLALEERDYPEKEIIDLLKKRVVPATIFDESYIPSFINNLKAQGKLVKGVLKLDRIAKEYLLTICNQYPSPMRVLEISVYALRNAKSKMLTSARDVMQKSFFVAGQAAQEIAQTRLTQILKSQEPAGEAPMPAAEEAVSLKDLQKRRPTTKKI